MLNTLKYFILAAWGLATGVPGAVVNIDVQAPGGNTMVGGSPVLSSGPYWNPTGANGAATPLLTSTGEGSGLQMTVSLYFHTTASDGDALHGDYAFGSVVIGGLVPGSDYEVVLYGAANIQCTLRVDQPFTVLSAPGDPSSGTYGFTTLPGKEGIDYVHLLVTPGAEGRLEAWASPGMLAGLQIGPLNPEPSALVLSTVGGLLLMVRRPSRLPRPA